LEGATTHATKNHSQKAALENTRCPRPQSMAASARRSFFLGGSLAANQTWGFGDGLYHPFTIHLHGDFGDVSLLGFPALPSGKLT